MKKTIILLFLAMQVAASVAQSYRSEVELVKSMFNTEKKMMVEAFMYLSEEEAQIFWPIYNNYEQEKNNVAMKRVELLSNYVESYENISNEQADLMMKEIFSIQKKDSSIKKKYYNQIKKALSARKATAFYQLEEYIQTSIRMRIMDNIPFVE